jgi:membrane protease YdiL (CAAX protease family)
LARLELGVTIIGIALFGAALATRDSLNPWWSNAGAGVLTIAMCLVALRRRLGELLQVRLLALLIAAGTGVALVVLTHGVYAVAVDLIPALEPRVAELYADIERSAPRQMVVVALILVIVVAEELLFRGVALALARRRFGVVAAGAMATGAYAVPQLIAGAWILLLTALVMGAVFTTLRLVAKGLVVPTATHAVWSACIFSLFPLT